MAPFKLDGARAVPTVCPYCAVGCGLIAHVKEGKLVNVEGDRDSPVNDGAVCPKGAASIQLALNAARWTTVRYRAPRSRAWEERPLTWAMERVARRIQETRDATFDERFMRTGAIASLGGAVFDNEENYALVKLLRGLGIYRIENQARV